MSEFQLGLLGIGIVVVLVVLAFNKWQEIRYRRQAEASLQPHAVDALLEPSGFGAMAVQEPESAPGAAPAQDAPGPAASGVSGEAPGASILRAVQHQPASSILSAAVDLVIELDSEPEITLSELRSGIPEGAMARRIGMEALVDGNWEMPGENERYRRVNLGLQLVNRQGAVSEQELGLFAEWVGVVASRCRASHAPLDLASAREAAVALDRFCGDVDILIAIHIVAGANPFPGTRIRAIAEAAGLAIEADGLFRKRDEEGRELYRLANEGNELFKSELMRELVTNSVVLEFDVARSPGGSHSFNKFRQFAEHLASGLGGKVVDDNRAPLGAAGFDAIAKELSGVYQAMAARGIAPGSPQSLRLFS